MAVMALHGPIMLSASPIYQCEPDHSMGFWSVGDPGPQPVPESLFNLGTGLLLYGKPNCRKVNYSVVVYKDK